MRTLWSWRACGAGRAALGAVIVVSLALAGGCASSSSSGTGVSRAPSGSYAFWPKAPAEPRIQFVRAFRSSRDVQEERASGFERLVFGEESEYEAVIEKPYGVDMRNGRIYVCDIRRPALTVLDIPKKQVRLIGVTGVNRLTHPVDVAVADDGWIYVADNDRDAILVFNPNERYAKTYGHTGMKPVSVAVHGERLYVCDLATHQVEIFDRQGGQSLGTFGGPGDADGQFRVPIGVDTDRDGYVYVSDMMRCRVQKFTPDGEFISGVGELGDYAGSFARPKQLAVDENGIIYVVDASFQNVQMFNEEYALLMSFGSAGPFPGSMNLPAGISVTDEGLDLFMDEIHPGFEPLRLVAVTNQFGMDKVSLYALGRLRQGWTVAEIASSSVEVSEGVGVNPEASRLQGAGEGSLPAPSGSNEGTTESEDASGGDGG